MDTKLILLILFTWTTSILLAQPQRADRRASADKKEGGGAITVVEARGRAEILHTAYLRTLHSMHREYFRDNDRLTVPSRALESVFHSVDRQTGGKTRWIAVNAPAMNIEHKPATDFEKEAARVLKGGESVFETVAGGVYQRAGAVTLFASCTKCHLGALANQQPGRRVAGLVISLPLNSKAIGK